MELILGNLEFSTWSLRPWLVLKRCGADFTVTEIPLYGGDWKERLAEVSPSGKVPLLKVDGETIWDSLSICVWAAERFPEAKLWPADPHARWLARSVTCEMHSGFTALRSDCAMGPDDAGVIHTMVGPDRASPPTGEAVAADVRRLVEIFRTMRARFGAGGPYLFGEWSIADAFFTPVAARIRHYQIDLWAHGDDGSARAYCEALLDQPDFHEWVRLATAPR
ncbi:MAG TPA: glutathione S-transferase [Brevundimonas sp.]|jgi:glutathione S-transferase|uniref:glutathione S-transferase n=1 Tax=Brevundimonas sp. TaxID=1871086 RepID=UPI002DEE824E|nr:glutathione S-transferase [Brevundimonas sp.]